jgi:hypothetical protein
MKKRLLQLMGAILGRPCSACRYEEDLPCSRCGQLRSQHKAWEGKCLVPGISCSRWVRWIPAPKMTKAPKVEYVRDPNDPVEVVPEIVASSPTSMEEVSLALDEMVEGAPRWDNP